MLLLDRLRGTGLLRFRDHGCRSHFMHASHRHPLLLAGGIFEMIRPVLDLRFSLGSQLASVIERKDVVIGAAAKQKEAGEKS